MKKKYVITSNNGTEYLENAEDVLMEISVFLSDNPNKELRIEKIDEEGNKTTIFKSMKFIKGDPVFTLIRERKDCENCFGTGLIIVSDEDSTYWRPCERCGGNGWIRGHLIEIVKGKYETIRTQQIDGKLYVVVKDEFEYKIPMELAFPNETDAKEFLKNKEAFKEDKEDKEERELPF